MDLRARRSRLYSCFAHLLIRSAGTAPAPRIGAVPAPCPLWQCSTTLLLCCRTRPATYCFKMRYIVPIIVQFSICGFEQPMAWWYLSTHKWSRGRDLFCFLPLPKPPKKFAPRRATGWTNMSVYGPYIFPVAFPVLIARISEVTYCRVWFLPRWCRRGFLKPHMVVHGPFRCAAAAGCWSHISNVKR